VKSKLIDNKLIDSKHRRVGVPFRLKRATFRLKRATTQRGPGGPRGGSTFQQKGDHPAGAGALTFSQILASTSRTDAANHLPPRAVGIPRSCRDTPVIESACDGPQ
jgi:hypothetical protein